ncbi:Regulator of chromosome condensation (RCC1) repeat protein [Rhodococcus erythropolis]|uniref:cutinase family protein n=1 Tax=Rhodococcus erythropolis TaxID=1833 RepID=UPI000BB2DA44|nr:cutinase family protein [Rhodococcus erythropolis]PBI98150.1 Regulator of chromosome condensation (RCC1) repeat protein [Rhodococcus erythropolis]
MLRRTVFDHRLSWLVAAVIAILVVSAMMMPSGVTARANADPVTTSTTATAPPSTTLVAGQDHTCALMAGGTAKCWGYNQWGALGDGTTTHRSTPVDVVGLSGAIALTAGGSHTCALMPGGTAKCWGYNGAGQVGDGTTTYRSTPVDVVGLSGATALVAGGKHTCALMAGGTAKCWGYNQWGQLGDGTTIARFTPVDVVGLSGATAVTASWGHSCALMAGGTAKCWGYNQWGGLGDGTTTYRSTPVDVVGLSGATALTAGSDHSCALLPGGTAKCWGYNGVGALGDGTPTYRSTLVDVVGLSGATALTAGSGQTCALLPGGTAKCWGYNGLGGLGDGTTTDRSTPVNVVGLSGATALTAGGGDKTCALLPGGTAKCWGDNEAGQLGDGTTTTRLTPVDVVGLTGIIDPGVPGNPEPVCKSTYFVGVRGSGQAPQGALPSASTYPVGTVDQGMGPELNAQAQALDRMWWATHSPPQAGIEYLAVAYPAVPVGVSEFDIVAGTVKFSGYGDAYESSVSIGEANLSATLRAINAACAQSSFVPRIALSGYSQGADVINAAMTRAQRTGDQAVFKNVVSIVHLGDPSKTDGRGIEVLSGTGAGVRWITPGKWSSVPSPADPARNDWIAANPGNTLFSFCGRSDIVCDTEFDAKLILGVDKFMGKILGQYLRPSVTGVTTAAVVATGTRVHTSYLSQSVRCAALGIPAGSTMTVPNCGASKILSAFGSAVPASALDPTPRDADGGVPQLYAAPIAPGLSGPPLLRQGQSAEVVFKGLPNTKHTVSARSEPIELGTVTTDADGLAVFTVTLPDALPDGEHRLIFTSETGLVYGAKFTVAHSAAAVDDAAFVLTEDNRVAETPLLPDPVTPPSDGTGSLGSLGSVFGS